MDPGILTRLLNSFTFVFTGGFTSLMPEAMFLLRTLAAIELTIVALWWALARDDALVAFLAKALWIGAFIYLVTEWPRLTQALVTSFIQAGLSAGGGGLTIRDFTNPSTIAGFGLEVTGVIFSRLGSLSGLISSIRNPHMVFIDGLAALGIVMAFFIMGIQIFISLLEFYLLSMLALLLVPFGVFRFTAFLAERAFGLIFAFGIKLMVLACITAAMLPVLVTLQIPADPTLNQVLSLLLASVALCMLSWHAPSVAAALLAGAPSLTASTAAHTVVAAGASLGLAAVAGVAALRAGTAVTRGALRAGGAVRQAYVTEGGLGGVRRLTAAVGQDSINAVRHGFRAAYNGGRVYSALRLNGQTGFRRSGSATGGTRGTSIAPGRFVGRVVPPQSHPHGGLRAPLDP